MLSAKLSQNIQSSTIFFYFQRVKMIRNSLRSVFVIFQITAFFFAFIPKCYAVDNLVKTPQTVFSNPQSIAINTASGLTAPTKATLYPTQIEVSGMTGNITNLSVTLKGITHQNLPDIDMLLVGPTGVKYILVSDGLGSGQLSIDDKIITLTNGVNIAQDSDTFPSPAPAAPYLTPPTTSLNAAFGGTNPNGTWSLYVVDDRLVVAGNINSGWALSITTDGAPTTFANPNYIGLNDILEPSAPYGSPINVSGLSGVVSNITVTLNGLSHTASNDIDILLVSPNGKAVVIMSDVTSPVPINNATITLDDNSPNTFPSPIVSGTYRTFDNGDGTGADVFPNPAPLRPYDFIGLESFRGFNPNGDWRLYVVDDNLNNSGSIAGGWSVDISTVPPAPPSPGGCAAPSFTPSSFATGTNPTNLVVADFNNDNKQDVAVTNQVSNDVSILLGNGNGTFGTQTLLTAGSSPYAIVAGKFNADNNVDLAVANSVSNNVSILLGNGNGTFSAATNFFAGSNPISIASGDINNNGTEDLIVANFGGFFSGSVSVLLGNGSGGFTSGTSIRTRTQPSFVTIANLNADSNKDVIVANFGSDSVTTFFGSGSGTFQLNQNISTGAGPVAIELFDSNTDGISDLSVANYNGDSITSCRGSANGNFTSCNVSSGGGANPISLTSADFVGNGTKNLATALSGSNLVKVLTSNVAVGQFPNAVKTADFNGDNKPDLVSANSGSNDISVLINSCLASKGNLFDFDGDRRTDYTIFRPQNSNWYTLFSTQNTFTNREFARPTDKVLSADFDGDGLADYAYYRPETGLWSVIANNSRPLYFLGFGLSNDIPVPADYDGDGKADIAVFRPSNGTWFIRRSSDNSLQSVNFGMNGDNPLSGDFDGDGKDDIAIFRPSTGLWAILKSSDGQFILTTFGMSGDKAVPADYDGDSKFDIAVYRPSEGAWYILQSTAGFRAVTWGNSTDIPVRGDFEGDGKYDVGIYRPSDGTWYILKSSDNGGIFTSWGTATDTPIPSVYVR